MNDKLFFGDVQNVTDKLEITQTSYPCKNGCSFLSKADYDSLPYCNSCICSFRSGLYFVALVVSLIIAILSSFGHFYLSNTELTLSEHSLAGIANLLEKLTPSIIIFLPVLLISALLLIIISHVINNKKYPYHK